MVPLGYAGLPSFTPPSKELLWGSVYAALTFHYNSYYFVANAPGLTHWAPLWSLSIEEIFYLTFPLVCFLTRRRTVLLTVLAGLIIGGPFEREGFAGIFSFWGAADLLAMGCLAALALDHCRAQLSAFSWPLRAAGGAIILYIFVHFQVRQNFTLAPTGLGLGTALFLIGAASAKPVHRPNRVGWPITALGRVSYEIYVFHVALILALMPAGLSLLRTLGAPEGLAHLTTSVIMLALLYSFGAALSRFVTEPLNAGIRRFYAR